MSLAISGMSFNKVNQSKLSFGDLGPTHYNENEIKSFSAQETADIAEEAEKMIAGDRILNDRERIIAQKTLHYLTLSAGKILDQSY